MPSIEIACVGLAAPVHIEAETFAVAYEPGLKSHRVPSRFQEDFDRLTGCLYHLGNPRLRDPRKRDPFFAYELLSVESREPFPPSFLEFSPAHVGEIGRVLEGILAASPPGRVVFTSDWQFGPEWTHRFGPLTLAEFWSLHEARALYLNTAYTLVA